MTRKPSPPDRRRAATGLLLPAAALLLSGCSALSPHVIDTPYPAADGTNSEVTDPATGATVQLRDFLLVGSAKGKPAVLLGDLVNEGDKPVTLSLSVLDDSGQAVATGQVVAQPGVLTKVGPGGVKLDVAAAPAAAGATARLRAFTAASGGATLTLPVLGAEGSYASITPAG